MHFSVYILITNSAILMFKLKHKGYNYIIRYTQKFLKLHISLFLLVETCNVSQLVNYLLVQYSIIIVIRHVIVLLVFYTMKKTRVYAYSRMK